MAQTQNMYLGILAGLGLGLLAGALNGILVAFLKLNAIVVTLGFLSVWGGFAQLITGGRTVQRSQLPEEYRALGTFTIIGIPISPEHLRKTLGHQIDRPRTSGGTGRV
jgi:ribose/xylose/arabinose/galactoside ABC-type transport system permease subunit